MIAVLTAVEVGGARQRVRTVSFADGAIAGAVVNATTGAIDLHRHLQHWVVDADAIREPTSTQVLLERTSLLASLASVANGAKKFAATAAIPVDTKWFFGLHGCGDLQPGRSKN